MSDAKANRRLIVLLVTLFSALAFTGCLGPKHGKGKPPESEAGKFGATNWFSTSTTPEEKKANTNAPAAAQPDNTVQNKRESNGDTLTPFDQGSGQTDRKITQNLRKAITLARGKKFSFLARNIKI